MDTQAITTVSAVSPVSRLEEIREGESRWSLHQKRKKKENFVGGDRFQILWLLSKIIMKNNEVNSTVKVSKFAWNIFFILFLFRKKPNWI